MIICKEVGIELQRGSEGRALRGRELSDGMNVNKRVLTEERTTEEQMPWEVHHLVLRVFTETFIGSVALLLEVKPFCQTQQRDQRFTL